MVFILSKLVKRTAIWLLGNTEVLSFWKHQTNRGTFRSCRASELSADQGREQHAPGRRWSPAWWCPGGGARVAVHSHAGPCPADPPRKLPGLGLTAPVHSCRGSSRSRWGVKGPSAPLASAAQDFTWRWHSGALCEQWGTRWLENFPCERWCYTAFYSDFPASVLEGHVAPTSGVGGARLEGVRKLW